ncbi:hypothetical protein Bcav_2213 [Beutenbergia cavernae DSM 12333]|uniref:Uncharacterized protein n=1 Tax=Beutenbergia cavernae (strain ATCC BAA-8 / DSM 12333 / CCUG 43141 / JCM 11478 / NBRC 16432 / NCIMB 13614 / HKI 0122) TaxID=471853 RepID=C5BV77_BEUC1|nr:hypothetical protein [Beutenbergia cavernae]ACQ80464.1 hypothetical protein Bcav_2213 [Beutenbergia cavernae DSM 12333]
MRARTGAVVAAVVASLALLLAACVPDTPEPPDPADAASTEPDSAPSSSGKPPGASGAGPCGDPRVDLTQVAWEWPAGFTESTAYSQVVPLGTEQVYGTAVPDASELTLDVLAVVVYGDVPTQEPTAKQPDRITCAEQAAPTLDEIHAALDATVLEGPVETEVAGLPAVWEVLDQPGGYRYEAIWVPSGDQLLLLECQWEHSEDLIRDACDDLLASVRLP